MDNKKKNVPSEAIDMLQWILPTALLFLYIVITLYTVQASMRKNGEKLTEEKLTSYGQTVTEKMNTKVSEVGAVARTIAATLEGETFSGRADAETVEKYIGNISRLTEAGVVTEGYVIDGAGHAIDQHGDMLNLEGQEWYENLPENSGHAGYIVSDIVPGEDGGYSFYIASPIHSTNGWVALNVTADFFRSIPSTTQYDAKTQYLFVASDGTVLSSVGPSAFESGTDLFGSEGVRPDGGQDVMDRVKSNFAHKRSGNLKCNTETGEKCMIYMPVKQKDWYVVILATWSYVQKDIDNYCKPLTRVIVRLLVALAIFLILITSMNVIGKAVYNKRRKDLQDKAETDLLTGLLNKISTENHIKNYLENEGKGVQGMFFLLDIDNFKKINDTMGHAFGDEVLSTLGQDLSTEFRATDIVGRLGGDEFAVFLKDIRTDEIRDREAARVLDFFRNFKAGEYVKYSATASIGVSMYPKDGSSFEELYKAADQAVYQSKRHGKNRLTFYDRKFQDEAPDEDAGKR